VKRAHVVRITCHDDSAWYLLSGLDAGSQARICSCGVQPVSRVAVSFVRVLGQYGLANHLNLEFWWIAG
jgi:hypothetical protein